MKAEIKPTLKLADPKAATSTSLVATLPCEIQKTKNFAEFTR